MSDDEFVSDDADEKVGVYERDEDWVAMEKEMNEEDYVLTSDNEQMNEPSNSDIRFVEQNNCTYKLRYYTVHLERGMVLEDIHICHTKKIYAL